MYYLTSLDDAGALPILYELPLGVELLPHSIFGTLAPSAFSVVVSKMAPFEVVSWGSIFTKTIGGSE